MNDKDIKSIVNAVKPGLVLQRTIGKYKNPEVYTKKFNYQLEDEIRELEKSSTCKMIPGSTSINWMSIPANSVASLTPYQRWIYYSCRIRSMRRAGIASDIILHSLSNEFSFLGAGAFGTIGMSSKDASRPRTSSDIVMKSTTDNNSPNDLIHELFVGTYLNQLSVIGVPNFVKMYGYTASCNTPYVTESGKIESGCERQGAKASILMEKIDNPITFGEFVVDHISDRNKIPGTESDAISVVVEIFLQLFAALAVAQKQMKFVHLDLHVANILIIEHPSPIETTYQMSNRLLTVKSRYQPIIIDFGMSSINIGCKVYVDRRIAHLDIARVDVLEDAFIPWYDNHRVLSSMVAYADTVPNATSSLLYKVICRLFMMNYEGKPSSVNEVSMKLPTITHPVKVMFESKLFDQTTIAARNVVRGMVNAGNGLYQSSMNDYDLNTPECMVRMMTTRREIYQFISMSAIYSEQVELYNVIVPTSGNFGSLNAPTPSSLIDLKMYVMDRIRSAGGKVTARDGSLSRWKVLIAPSVKSFSDDMKRVLDKSVNKFDLMTGIQQSTDTSQLGKFILESEVIYDYQSMARRTKNWKNDILEFLVRVDPSYLRGELSTFNDYEARLNKTVNKYMIVLAANYASVVMDIEQNVNNDDFMNRSMTRDVRDRLISSRQKVKDGSYQFLWLRDDAVAREYYLSTYVKMYTQTLSRNKKLTKERVNNVVALINIIIDWVPM